MSSITDGLAELEDRHLGLDGCGVGRAPHFKLREVQQSFDDGRRRPTGSGRELADALLARVAENWRAAGSRRGSKQNWRFTKAGEMSEGNTSPEVTFERVFVSAADDDWANQVPTSSGVAGEDRRRSIDLVHRPRSGEFELIELKLLRKGTRETDTPLHAAVEVLEYGVLYAFSRIHAGELGYQPGFSDILEAKRITLVVLAPRECYIRRNHEGEFGHLAWLQEFMEEAADQLAARVGHGLAMRFRFEVFPEDFTWNRQEDDAAERALGYVAGRRPLVSS